MPAYFCSPTAGRGVWGPPGPRLVGDHHGRQHARSHEGRTARPGHRPARTAATRGPARCYNAMIDRRPAAILRCRDAGDVMEAVTFVREHGLRPDGPRRRAQRIRSERGGRRGHRRPVADALDPRRPGVPHRHGRRRQPARRPRPRHARLRPRDPRRHPVDDRCRRADARRRARPPHPQVRPDRATICCPRTWCSPTAASSRRANGRTPTCSGRCAAVAANFGVVTSFTFRLHPVDTVGVALTLWPVERDAARCCGGTASSSRRAHGGAERLLRGAHRPAGPAVPRGDPRPEDVRRRVVLDRGARGPRRRASPRCATPGTPAFHFTTPMPYPALQSMFDELLPPGLQWYWRGDFFDRITDEAIDVHAHVRQRTSRRRCRRCTSTRWTAPPAAWATTPPRGTTATPCGPASSPASTPIRPTPTRSSSGASTTGRRCTRTSMGGGYVNFIGAGRGPGTRQGQLPRPLRQADRDQGDVRPGQPVPRKHEHQPAVGA